MKTIIEMAREAGLIVDANQSGFDSVQTFTVLVTEQANARANTSWALMCKKMVAIEREACAKVCEQGLPIASSLSALDDMEMWGEKFAVAIRARGNT